MKLRGKRFEVDKANAKIAGVCAGIGNHLGVDPTIVRIGFVLCALLGKFWLALAGYAVLAFVAQPGGAGRKPRRAKAPAEPEAPLDERLRAHDRRMREIDTFVAGSNSRLAREIEELR